MLQLVLAMGGQGQIGWAATSILPPAALGLAGASWSTANGKKLTTAWRSKQHCRYSVSLLKIKQTNLHTPATMATPLTPVRRGEIRTLPTMEAPWTPVRQAAAEMLLVSPVAPASRRSSAKKRKIIPSSETSSPKKNAV